MAGAWRDRWIDVRNRILGSPRFQRLATRLPLVRIVSRRRARRLFDLCAGFVYSQVLLACIRLKLLELLREGPRDVATVADRLSLPPQNARRLLEAAAALELVDALPEGRFALGAQGAALLANPGIAAMVEHHALLYRDLADPVALLRGDERDSALGDYWPYATSASPKELADDAVAQYSELMSSSLTLVADLVLDAYPLAKHRCLLDVGGGQGSFLIAAGGRAPALRLLLFDLPAVAERAEARLEEAGLDARARVHGGDFRYDPLPSGADVASLVRIIHDHDDEEAARILRNVHDALPEGGVLLLAEPMSGTPGAETVGDAYFGFYLLAMGSGRPRCFEELESLVREAGFDDVSRIPTRLPLQAQLLVARRGPDPASSERGTVAS